MRHEVWKLERGATLLSPHETRFTVWAPNAARVAVRVHDGPSAGLHPMKSVGRGVFEATVAGVGAGTLYSYRLDDAETDYPDPVSRAQPCGVHGASRVVDPSAHVWRDREWRGIDMPDLVIYELHIGTFSDEGTFDGAIGHLAELKELGITAIEIMPVAEFPGSRNWGYDGVLPYAAQSSYGGPDALKRLVDGAHEVGLAVILDVVYNHMGPEGNYLGAFGPYFTERYRTPWGGAVNYDDADSDEVRRFVIDNALYWITEFHIDGLRLDAVHAIYDFSARHLLAELADAVHAQGNALGRRTVVIAESDLNDPRLLRDAERGGFELDAQWSDDFHHAVHATLAGEQQGYYEDFGDGVASIAKALRDRFVYDGRYSAHRKRRHGAPATDVPADRFVIALQNHDQVGNRATGERLSSLISHEKTKLAAMLLLASPYVPLLFMGEEYAEPRPFQYFVSHGDEQLVEAVRVGRRNEFRAFDWRPEDVPDPQAEHTFLRSKLDRDASARPENAAVLRLYRDLLRARREERALRPGDARVDVATDDATWIAMRLTPTGEHAAHGKPLMALFNLSDEPRTISCSEAFGEPVGAWKVRIATDDRAYGGDDGTRTATAFTLAPWTAALYRKDVAIDGISQETTA